MPNVKIPIKFLVCLALAGGSGAAIIAGAGPTPATAQQEVMIVHPGCLKSMLERLALHGKNQKIIGQEAQAMFGVSMTEFNQLRSGYGLAPLQPTADDPEHALGAHIVEGICLRVNK